MKIYKTNLQRVLYLNSANATKQTTSGGKNLFFSWNVPDIIINELGTIQCGSIASQNASSTAIYTFRLVNCNTNNTANFSSDGGSPILFSLLLNNFNSTFTDQFITYLSPQTINNITLQISDDFTNKDAGIGTAVNFVICLVINEIQIQMNEIGQPYADAITGIDNRVARNLRLH